MIVRTTLVALLALTAALAAFVYLSPDDAVEVLTTAPEASRVFAPGEPIVLERGEAWLTCGYERDVELEQPARPPLSGLAFDALRDIVRACVPAQLIHLHYSGGVNADVARLVEAVTVLADELDVRGRVIVVDSQGGDVMAAMATGDFMGDHDWAMWVPRGASCHSACTMLLAAARHRAVWGEVGIHRVFAAHSTATSREELAADLEQILERIRAYLMRHGVSTQLADAMMAVPAREIRVLTIEELTTYGLVGPNAAQADLERVQLVQRCGMQFARRAEAWTEAHAADCITPWVLRAIDEGVSPRRFECEVLACGRRLEARFGFPDAACPEHRPIERTSSWHFCDERSAAEAQPLATEAQPLESEARPRAPEAPSR